MQEIVLFCHLACYHLGTFLAVTHRSKTFSFYSVCYQIVDNALGSALTQFLVVLVLASIVAMGGKFYGDIGVLVQQIHQTVQCLSTAFCQCCAVELIEYVADEYGIVDTGQRELQDKLLTDTACVHVQFLFMIQITLAGTKEYIIYIGGDFLDKGTVAAYAQLLVGTIVTHHIDKSLWQFVSIFFIDPSLDGMNNLGTFERHDMIPSAGITSVGAEESSVVESFKGHAEVVSATVHGNLQILYLPIACCRIAFSLEDIQSTHAHMSVAGEVKFAVRTERGKHLVALGINRGT